MNPDLTKIEEELGKLGHRVKEIGDEIKSLVESESAESKARISELQDEQKKLLEDVTPLIEAKEKAELAATVKQNQSTLESLLSQVRTSSKADLIGKRIVDASPDYQAGAFVGAMLGLQSRDPETYATSKATLQSISRWEDAWGKATLGSTDATGGWIVPNALVDELLKPAQYRNPYRQICTYREGVTAAAIDLPVRGTAPSRMTVQHPRGSTKENVDLPYGGYTATMYTIARIHDVANQFLKQSLGAAERDVMEELAHAATLGERYYIVDGSGTNEPYGIQSAFTFNALNTFVTSFSPAATLAGSISAAIAKAAGALGSRNREPNAAVLSATSYWAMLAEGTDEAGFFFSPANGPEGIRPGTLVSPFGIPVYPDSQLSQSDDLIVGDFSQLKVFIGDSFRIDSSSVAGNRWDENETGFRGEMEIGLDARAALFAGALEKVADVVP